MGKSFNNKGFYEDFDYGYDDNSSYRGGKIKPNKNNDKKIEIQKARKKAQAERDKAILELNSEED